MTKIEAITNLLSGNGDKAVKNRTVLLLDRGSVVNQRTGKTVEMKNLTEDGWEIMVDPKWYDDLPKLCVIDGTVTIAVEKITDENGKVKQIVVQGKHEPIHVEEVIAATIKDVTPLLFEDAPETKKKKTSKKEKPTVTEKVEDQEHNENSVDIESNEKPVETENNENESNDQEESAQGKSAEKEVIEQETTETKEKDQDIETLNDESPDEEFDIKEITGEGEDDIVDSVFIEDNKEEPQESNVKNDNEELSEEERTAMNRALEYGLKEEDWKDFWGYLRELESNITFEEYAEEMSTQVEADVEAFLEGKEG